MAIPPFGSVPGYSKGNFTLKPTASDHATLGNELLASPSGFNNATNWTLGAGWTSTSGNTQLTAATATSSVVATAANLPSVVAGSFYRVQFRLNSITAGTVSLQLGSTLLTLGTYATFANTFGYFAVLVPADTTGFQINGTGFSGVISTFSIKLITPANAPLAVWDSTGALVAELRDNGLAVASLGLGLNSLRSNTLTTAANHVAFGSNALRKVVTGTGMIAIGQNALSEASLASKCVAIGRQALALNIGGQGHVAIGDAALGVLQGGTANVAIGQSAGGGITGASNNTLIGAGAGGSITTGSGNTCIGGVDVATPTTSNTVNIENVYFGDMSGLPRLAGIIVQAPKSVLDVGGALATPIVAKSSAYSMVSTDSTVLATGTTTITLPTAVGIAGRHYAVKKTDAGGTNVTVAGNGVELIDGANTFVLSTQYAAVSVQSDGTQWWIISSH